MKDYLRKDYYDAVFEAAKGLAERVRQITGLTTDGGTLFQKALSKNDPYIFFNTLQTDSEISEFTGLKELLEAIFHLGRVNIKEAMIYLMYEDNKERVFIDRRVFSKASQASPDQQSGSIKCVYLCSGKWM
ncbi:MAG: TIGR02391 family protein [Clostridiales bacterium]|nr:TIGR02391 family protein [Clostridiales bacterium]